MNQNELRSACLEAEEESFQGWDFSKLDGRWQSESLPWDYRASLQSLLTPKDLFLIWEPGEANFY